MMMMKLFAWVLHKYADPVAVDITIEMGGERKWEARGFKVWGLACRVQGFGFKQLCACGQGLYAAACRQRAGSVQDCWIGSLDLFCHVTDTALAAAALRIPPWALLVDC
jgi:hypothetical protein